MPKVSVLMNCFNGEKFLKEAIDSVYAQTFSDWEIVFIDNCSTDESAKIAKSYGEKLKYYKTENNIPLGAARAWGMQYCKGEYVAFLDTDDIWLPKLLEELIKAIESDDYALAYAGQIEIDKNGKPLQKMIPSYKKGHIFAELLMQYDIPLVTAMIRRTALDVRGLNFDEKITASEEYCLFMQLAVDTKMIVVPKALVQYRVYGESLTNRMLSKRSSERYYTLKKIIDEHPGIEQKYSKEFKEAYARGAYYETQYLMSQGKHLQSFKTMSKYMFVDPRYFFLALLTIMPKPVWDCVQEKKYKRK